MASMTVALSSGDAPAILFTPQELSTPTYHIRASLHTTHRFQGHPRLSVPVIGIDIERLSDDEVIASFEGISMSGSNDDDAVDALFEALLDMLDLYSANEENLGPVPKRELAVLRHHFIDG